jgi:hypothetical protein
LFKEMHIVLLSYRVTGAIILCGPGVAMLPDLDRNAHVSTNIY